MFKYHSDLTRLPAGDGSGNPAKQAAQELLSSSSFAPQIWDLETDSCLFTTSSKASGIRGEPRACLYLPDPRALCVAADAIALLHLRQR